jgi:predicted DNA repair protein MutK
MPRLPRSNMSLPAEEAPRERLKAARAEGLMAGASLLALLDDIAALMDDVSVMTKVAARKTAGVLGDDLAVNAEKVTGVAADRELPVVFAVFRGSLINKAILVPAALLIAAVAPWLIGPLLMAGGLFLCYEGSEKLWHSLAHSRSRAERDAESRARFASRRPVRTPIRWTRKRKIRGAIRTDFILSAEIIVITLGYCR